MSTKRPWNKGIRRRERGGFGVLARYNVRAQNGPGIAVVEHRPGPDLSASLDYTEEH